MQLETLKIFCDVVRRNSFSRGAAENNVTQSMASQAVHRLEEHFQVPLIDRSHRPWRITDEGKICYESSRDLLERYAKLEKKLRHIHRESTLTIRIATIYSAGLVHMKPLLEELKKRSPHAKTKVEYFHPNVIYRAVSANEADIGIISFPKLSHRDLHFTHWIDEEMVVAVAPEHPFAQKKEIPIKDLEKDIHIGFDPDLEIRRGIRKFFKQYDVHLKTEMHFDNIESIKRAVEIGPGFSLLPLPCLAREIESKSLVQIPLKDVHFTRPLYIVQRKGKEALSEVQQFIDLMLEKSP